MNLETINNQRSEYNLPPILQAKLDMNQKGWSHAIHLQNNNNSYTFESIKVKEGNRVIRTIFAKNFEEAVTLLTPPIW